MHFKNVLKNKFKIFLINFIKVSKNKFKFFKNFKNILKNKFKFFKINQLCQREHWVELNMYAIIMEECKFKNFLEYLRGSEH